MGRDKKKERYRMIPILLVMKCIRPILREIIIGYAKKHTPQGDTHWTVDDFLGHHRKQVERKIQTFDDYEKLLSVLYPSDGRSDFGKWNLKLTIFILNDVCNLGSNFKYYISDILNIRDQLCLPQNSGVTRIVCKEYKRRLKSARSHFYRLLRNDDLKRTIERRAHNINKEIKNEDILKRWEELEKESVTNGCGKTGVQKYLTLNILLSETCSGVMQSLIKKIVKKKGHRSIDVFLLEHEKRIRRRINTLDGYGRAEDMLLPPKGRRTNMHEWDVTLLCWVLLNVCFLDECLADAIGSIRRVRNETIHKLSTSMNVSDLEYQRYFEDITKSIDICLLYLNDAEFSEDIHNKIEEIDRSGVDKDETIRRLQICQNDRVEHELQNKHLRGQAVIIEELSQILKTISGFELPACTLEVMLQNCSEECEKELSNILVERINEVIGKDAIPEHRNDELTTAIKDFVDRYKEKGWKPLCAENGSVLFQTKCNSFKSLCELYDTNRDEGSRSFVSAVEDAVQHMLGRRVHLCVVMHNAEMDKCMEAIVSLLYKRNKELEAKVNAVKAANKGRLNIWMALNGEESSRDTSGNDDKGLVQQLSRIADILRKRHQTPNLTVTTTLHDLSEESYENLIDKEGTICDFSRKEQRSSDINEKMHTEVICGISCSCSDEKDRMLCDPSGNEQTMSNKNRTMKRRETELEQSAQECKENKEKQAPKEGFDLGKRSGKAYSTNICGSTIEVTKVDEDSDSFEPDMNRMQVVGPTPHNDVENTRMDLISYYRKRHSHICLSPLPCDETANIDDLFVPLNMQKHFLHPQTKLRKHSPCSDISEVSEVTNYYDIFYCNGDLMRKIYVTGGAGLGKTTFCKKLVLDWCKSWHGEFSSPLMSSKPDTENQMHSKKCDNPLFGFHLVFFVLLGGEEATSVEDIIRNQLGISKERLAEYFRDYECLIILDGLDEWTRPKGSESKKIPLLQLQNRCTTLVTSRISILDQAKADLDEHMCELAIKGIGNNSHMLIRSIFRSIVKGKSSSKRYSIAAEVFLNEIGTTNIDGLLSNPNVLKILIYLWRQKGKLGPSLNELYGQISVILIRQACLENPHGNGAAADISLDSEKCIKACAARSSFMLSLLQSLTKLAYFKLFSEKENVKPLLHCQTFGNDLTSSERDILLRSGILTQNARFLCQNLSRYEFAHESFQENIATAFISLFFNRCIGEIMDTYLSLEKRFEMSNVFLFLSSMNLEAMKSVYYHIGRLHDGEETNQVYRSLCENGKLVESNYVILVSPLDGRVVDTVHERLFNFYKRWKLSVESGDYFQIINDATTYSPFLLYLLLQKVKINTDFDDMLSVSAKKFSTFLHIYEPGVWHFVNRFQKLESWYRVVIPEEDLKQPFASPPNCENVICFCLCCHADENGILKFCEHCLKTERSSRRVCYIQTKCPGICSEKVNFSNTKKIILELCLCVNLRRPEPMNRDN